jgi:hypothetical protein
MLLCFGFNFLMIKADFKLLDDNTKSFEINIPDQERTKWRNCRLGIYVMYPYLIYKLCPSKNFSLEKFWDYVSNKLGKSLGHRINVRGCVFYYIKFQKNKAKTTESQQFSMFFQKKHRKSLGHKNFL